MNALLLRDAATPASRTVSRLLRAALPALLLLFSLCACTGEASTSLPGSASGSGSSSAPPPPPPSSSASASASLPDDDVDTDESLPAMLEWTSLDAQGLTPDDFTIAYRQTGEDSVLLVAESRDAGVWMIGVWDTPDGLFLGDPIVLWNGNADCSIWQEGQTTWLFCSATSVRVGTNTGAAPLWLSFTNEALVNLKALPDSARSGDVELPGDSAFFYGASDYWQTHRAVPMDRGFVLYEADGDDGWEELGQVSLTVASSSGNSTSVPQAPTVLTLGDRYSRLHEAPDWEFYWEGGHLIARDDDLLDISLVREVWVYDVTGDGNRDLCLVRRPQGGLAFLEVVDLVHGNAFTLDARLEGISLGLAAEHGALAATATLGGETTSAPLFLSGSALSTACAPEAVSSPASLTGGDFPLLLDFTGGDGAWTSSLLLQDDGSFTGRFEDEDGVSLSLCSWHGRFAPFDPDEDGLTSLTLDELVLDTGHQIGENWTEDDLNFHAAGPYGMDDLDSNPLAPGATFLLVGPETTEEDLAGMEEFLAWGWTPGCWGLCSADTQLGFRSLPVLPTEEPST